MKKTTTLGNVLSKFPISDAMVMDFVEIIVQENYMDKSALYAHDEYSFSMVYPHFPDYE